MVLQENFLFNATVADNIRAGQAAASREQIIQAALMAGADEFIVNLPQGYDTMLEEGAKNLSGGQRQRLAIARALLTRPEILILDEATSSLDPESERIVRENLSQIARNRTVIIVSHRLSMLKDADTIIVLQNGELVGQGPHEQLLQTCPLVPPSLAAADGVAVMKKENILRKFSNTSRMRSRSKSGRCRERSAGCCT